MENNLEKLKTYVMVLNIPEMFLKKQNRLPEKTIL